MLIQALCNYYDILSAEGKVLPEGYSKVKIHYLISLTEEGTIDNIINVQREIAESKKGKVVKRLVPKEVKMPERTEKSGIEANISEHRPLYIFGLNRDKKTGELSTEDRTGKAKKLKSVYLIATRDLSNLWLQFFLSQNQGFMRLFEKTVLK